MDSLLVEQAAQQGKARARTAGVQSTVAEVQTE